ncbi:MAG: bifunctional 4-hydroxy-3-methylbut-2-enyl diphosphate reductase/30S ribosomal protein S1 [Clostridiales bacterium]|nr:bifunctional 4-hydroxy-3-methylbut-2-enyl diphosphate reductase/30S ribosomal protein S1 [Clostridiales bacterium]
MREIIRAENAGFCFGVKQAIEKAEKAAKSGGNIYSMGSLIHNDRVTKDLEKMGVRIISSLDEAEDDAQVIIRSHGEGKAFYDEAAGRALRLVDATCPFVTKIHDLVSDTDKQVVIVGDKEHPEVMGVFGWCKKLAAVVSSYEEALELKGDDFFVVTQTTIRKDMLNQVLKALDEKRKKYTVRNTICSATVKRQESCEELSKKSDLMIVIGGKNSSNTKKLYEISKKYCANTFFVENIEDLPLKQLQKCNRIGIAAGASTPERTIKEVIASMSDVTLENNELNMSDLMDEIERSLRLPRGGEIVTGKIHQVTEQEVIVNLGCKKDGILPITEVTLEEGQTLADVFKVDDEIQAKVIKTDDGDGGILLSKKRLEISANWDEILKALEDKIVLEVKVTRPVNGGVIAEYKEVSGFIPLSQLSDHYVENSEEFIGQTMEVRVSRVDQRRNRVVFSHKMFLNEERDKLIAEIWENLNVDDVVEGTVMRFTDYGAFVDIGGIDGLLHISEISWGKLKHPQEVLSIGEKINVKVLSMNAEKGKISLGLKQNQPEPWSVIDDNYQVGQVIEGKVVQIKEYGAFVELEPGLDGLVHISEVAHKRVGNISDELTVGQEVSAKILEIDKNRKRISLSIRETLEPPTEDAEDTAPAEEATEEAVTEEAAQTEGPVAEEAPEEEAPAEPEAE